jgi:hypothetical protein
MYRKSARPLFVVHKANGTIECWRTKPFSPHHYHTYAPGVYSRARLQKLTYWHKLSLVTIHPYEMTLAILPEMQ